MMSLIIFIEGEKKTYLLSQHQHIRAETRYLKYDKIALALVHAARRLKPYFQGRLIEFYTKYLLRKILANAQGSSKLLEWASYPSVYSIVLERRSFGKGHAIDYLMSDSPIEDILLEEKKIENNIFIMSIHNKKLSTQAQKVLLSKFKQIHGWCKLTNHIIKANLALNVYLLHNRERK